MRVLLIEDNADIAANVVEYLEAEGFLMDYAMNGIGGHHLASTQPFDAIILDLMLPGMDGLTLCENLRRAGIATPILMLTARDTLPDKLAGFDAGTDDYLVKPFALPELQARLLALHQRGRRASPRSLSLADLEINLGTNTVSRSGKPLEINNVGIKILQTLIEASPNIVTRNELIYKIWQDHPPGSDALKSHIYNLRQVVDKPFQDTLIHTVRGLGYRIVDPHANSS